MISFQLENRMIRKVVQMPTRSAFMRADRTQKAIGDAHAQAVRQRWRALLLSIKSRLEEIESGISTVEQAFLNDIVIYTDDGRDMTVGQWLRPQLEANYATGKIPPMLPGPVEEAV